MPLSEEEKKLLAEHEKEMAKSFAAFDRLSPEDRKYIIERADQFARKVSSSQPDGMLEEIETLLFIRISEFYYYKQNGRVPSDEHKEYVMRNSHRTYEEVKQELVDEMNSLRKEERNQ